MKLSSFLRSPPLRDGRSCYYENYASIYYSTSPFRFSSLLANFSPRYLDFFHEKSGFLLVFRKRRARPAPLSLLRANAKPPRAVFRERTVYKSNKKGLSQKLFMKQKAQPFAMQKSAFRQSKRKKPHFEAKMGMTKRGSVKSSFFKEYSVVKGLAMKRSKRTNLSQFFCFLCGCRAFLCLKQRQEGKAAFPHFSSHVLKTF